MVTISMRVPVWCPACVEHAVMACERCAGTRTVEELFSAWLAVPPGVTDGMLLRPSVMLKGMVRQVAFRIVRR
jgi:DnaJ-class molecular chaperone